MVIAQHSRTQTEIEQRAAEMMRGPLDPNKTVTELFGPLEDWTLQLGPYRLVYFPFNQRWFYFDFIHESWEDTGYGPGEALFLLEGEEIVIQELSAAEAPAAASEPREEEAPIAAAPEPAPVFTPAPPPPPPAPAPAPLPDIDREQATYVAPPPAPVSALDEPTYIPAQAPAWKATLCNGPHAGESFRLGEQTRLGRSADNDICLEDAKASRHHALIQREGNSYVLNDQGSSNGTLLNGERLQQPVILKNTDIIQIGDTRLEVNENPG